MSCTARSTSPTRPRTYASKVKNAQEAHEAIRPAGESFRTPAQTGLTGEQFRLYELIWMRTVASQMKDATGQSVSVRIGGAAATGEDVVFSASGRVITFHGFLRAYVEGTDEGAAKDDAETRLPALEEGDPVSAAALSASGHETKPPARYTEATLIKELEEREIGRPSTYASIIGTILNRGYVYKKGTALVPAWLAFSVIRLLEEHFPRQVSYEFTAVHGGRARRDRRRSQEPGQRARPSSTTAPTRCRACTRWSPSSARSTPASSRRSRSAARTPASTCGSGATGPTSRAPTTRATRPASGPTCPTTCRPTSSPSRRRSELFANPAGEEIELGAHPETGLHVVAKNGRFGPYVTEVLPEDAPKSAKPRTGSLFKSMSLDTITLDDAVKLLSLPRVVGEDPESGEEITAQNGRYGPYLKKGTDSRSLTTEDQLFTITLDEALKIYAQPKQRGRAAAAPPLKELGNDPVSGQPVVVKSGRFGEYVTDGEYNATLRKDDTVEAITLERAAELLAERRERGPAKKAARRPRRRRPRSRPRRRRPRRPRRRRRRSSSTRGPLWRRSAPSRRFSA